LPEGEKQRERTVKRANDQKGTMETVQNEQAKCEDGQVNESSKSSCPQKIKAVQKKKLLNISAGNCAKQSIE